MTTMSTEEMMKKVATQIGVGVEALSAQAESVYATESAGWLNAGKTEEECRKLAMRVAARKIAADRARLNRTGATLYEGMFLSVPREKDWGKMAYNKMKNTLASMPDMAQRLALVEQGAIYLYENNHDGTWTRHGNPSLLTRQAYEAGMESKDVPSVPERSMALDANTSFSIVWDKNNRTFANGNENFKYGSPRPLEELDRTCIFMGRAQGTSGAPEIIEVRLSGEQAKIRFPTYVTGTIGLKAANRAGLAYGTKATEFTADPNVASAFPSPPLVLGDSGPTGGAIHDWLGDTVLQSIEKCAEHYANLDQKAKWETQFATICEVVDINPRDNGGFTVSVADVDIMSSASVVDIYVSPEEEGEVDFGVGSGVVIVGSPWVTRDGETRFMVNGWWCIDRIAPLADIDGGDGWD